MKKHLLLFATLTFMIVQASFSQTVPPHDGKVHPWKHGNLGTNWDTSPYKAYIINGMPFRLMYPANFDSTVVDTQKYPLVLLLHGIGEKGTDNNLQLKYGGNQHKNAILSGKYNGFVLVPQHFSNYFGPAQFEILDILFEELIKNVKVDPNRIHIQGYSAGGDGTWQFIQQYPKRFASAIPMSAANSEYVNWADQLKYTAIWHAQGALDKRPHPTVGQGVADAFTAAGANYKYQYYKNLGHGTWTTMYQEGDFFPFLMRNSLLNIHVLHHKFNFCNGETISGKMGVRAGFEAYEWRKNGVLIPGATTNEITFNSVGDYTVRFKRNGVWTQWSEPLKIKVVAPTATPTITASGSTALPTLDGKNSVTLYAPKGLQNYKWSTGATTDSIVVSTAGSYSVSVTEPYGCPSSFSSPIKVTVNAVGVVTSPSNLTVATLSEGSLQLEWSDLATNETGYEIYRATNSNGPWKLVAQLPANTTSYIDKKLLSNTTFHYQLRAINNEGSSNYIKAIGKTKPDLVAPSIPSNLMTTVTSRSSIALRWSPSTDNIDAAGSITYDIYTNNKTTLVGSTKNTDFTVQNLEGRKVYNFAVIARDQAGNKSGFSNQVSAASVPNGLFYSYYEAAITSVVSIESLTPKKTGIIDNFTLQPREVTDYFAFKFEGFITIPTDGNYTFYTTSDDGSQLFIDEGLIVENDGIHGSRERSNTTYLSAGQHAIKVVYFDAASTDKLEVRWAGPWFSKQLIPTSALKEDFTMPAPPVAPSNIQVSALDYQSIRINWQDNSNNESGFEVYRSTSNTGTFELVTTTSANTTTFTDTKLAASTKYFYKVRSVGANGESKFGGNVIPGVNYEYYTGSFSNLSGIVAGSVTPTKTGNLTNFSLEPRTTNSNFAFRYIGKITVPASGEYKFYTASDDGSRLLINGTQVVYNDYTQGLTERGGSIILSAGKHDIVVAYRQNTSTYGLEVSYEGPGIPKQLIPDGVLGDQWPNATTAPLPPVPKAPSNLKATALSTTSIALSWTDNASDEVSYEVYRNDELIASLESNAVSYEDKGLKPHTTYNYKVTATNAGGPSASNIVPGTTKNTLPVLEAIESFSVRYGTSTTFTLKATDGDKDKVGFSGTNLPSFVTLVDNGNNTAQLTVAPSSAQQGVYANVSITANDKFGGLDTETFTITVNDNWVPAINAIANQTVAEGNILNISVSASDANGDAMTLGVTGADFASITDNGNGKGTLRLSPSFKDAGTHEVTVTALDSRGAKGRLTFTVTVQDVKTNFISYINFNDTWDPAAGTPWNNFQQYPNAGTSLNNIKDDVGQNLGINITLLNGWGKNNYGATTGNNSGVYPDDVMKTFFFKWNDDVQKIKVSGLKQGLSYSFEFFASSTYGTNNGNTNYTINNTTVSLATQNNTTNTVRIENVEANANGEVTINVQRAPGSPYAYINAMVIEGLYDDGTIPIAPTNLVAYAETGKQVELSWTDNSYNETGYEIWRATGSASNFAKVATVKSDVTSYSDKTTAGRKTYYYQVRAINKNGNSSWSNVTDVVTPNSAPVIAGLLPVIHAKEGQSTSIAINATDAEGDAITFSSTGLPSFATLTTAGNGNATLTLSPSFENLGTYNNISITATDGTLSETFTFAIDVFDSEKLAVYVNFGLNTYNSTSWNNLATQPYPGKTFNNLKNQLSENSGLGITLTSPWSGAYDAGMSTGNNSGVYPDEVMKTYYWTHATNTESFKITGLNPNYTYNVKFFASSNFGSSNGYTKYTINGKTVSLNVQSNTDRIVQLNGIKGDANGEVTVQITGGTGATYAYLNALAIEYYQDNGIPLRPDNLKATVKSRSQIELSWLDNSYNELGFQIFRKTLPNGNFMLIHQTGPNETSYVNSMLSSNTGYAYKVRAVTLLSASKYSNTQLAATLLYSVHLNFNYAYNEGSPWNNLNRIPMSGDRVANLRNDLWEYTSVTYNLDEEFDGTNPFGTNTGNNSGVYPDRVMRTFYFNEVGRVATIRFEGLNRNLLYNFRFFGASTFGTNNGVTEYRIGDAIVNLDVQDNIRNTVAIKDVRPNTNGEVSIEVESGHLARYGYLNALVIEVYDGSKINKTPAVNGSYAGESQEVAVMNESLDKIEKAYPNPTSDVLYVDFTAKYNSDYKVEVSDLAGRIIYQQVFKSQEGINTFELDLERNNIKQGMYILKVKSGEFESNTIKFIKK